MKNLEDLKQFLESGSKYISTNNYYYQQHQCCYTDDNIRVFLDTKVKFSNDLMILFGKCPHCQAIFYHEEYDSNTF